MALFWLHFMCWYFLLTEGAITLSQMSLLSAPSGFIKWHAKQIEAVFLIGQIFLQSILEELEFQKKEVLTEVIHRFHKVCLESGEVFNYLGLLIAYDDANTQAMRPNLRKKHWGAGLGSRMC